MNNHSSYNSKDLPSISNSNSQYIKKIIKIQKFKEKAVQMDRYRETGSIPKKSNYPKDNNNVVFPSIPLNKLLKSQVVNMEEEDNISVCKKVSKINDNFYKRLLGLKETPQLIEKEDNSHKKSNKSFFTNTNKNMTAKASVSLSPPQRNNNTLRNSIDKNVINLNPIKQNQIETKTLPQSKESSPTKDNNTHKEVKKKLPPIVQKQKKEICNTYCILPGNNSKLITTCMKTRPKWESCERSISGYANLFWTPLSKDIIFIKNDSCSYQYVNHLEHHSEISNKMKLFINLLKYCELNDIDLFSFFPLTVIFYLSHNSFFEQLRNFEKYYQELPSKDLTNNNVYKYYFSVNFSKRIGTSQRMSLPSTMYAGKNLWLIKPINLNRGRNIKVVCGIDNIVNEMNNLRNTKNFDGNNENIDPNNKAKKKPKAEYVLLQKYVERPLLYQNRKFDIRMWVLFTDKEELYVFKEGHLKATCDKYDVNSSDPYVHLTNYSVQKHNMNFSKNEIGNEISFEAFQNELNRTTQPIINFKKDILPKIYNIVKITFNAVKTKINIFGRKNSFEIFGYDFLIDSNYNPYLIEVNTNPGYEESSPLIKMLVPRMIDDALRLTIDVGYPRKNEDGSDPQAEVSSFEVKGYSNKENMWQKLRK